jgi:hypothetical protein
MLKRNNALKGVKKGEYVYRWNEANQSISTAKVTHASEHYALISDGQKEYTVNFEDETSWRKDIPRWPVFWWRVRIFSRAMGSIIWNLFIAFIGYIIAGAGLAYGALLMCKWWGLIK